jgi:hypothetical protein
MKLRDARDHRRRSAAQLIGTSKAIPAAREVAVYDKRISKIAPPPRRPWISPDRLLKQCERATAVFRQHVATRSACLVRAAHERSADLVSPVNQEFRTRSEYENHSEQY